MPIGGVDNHHPGNINYTPPDKTDADKNSNTGYNAHKSSLDTSSAEGYQHNYDPANPKLDDLYFVGGNERAGAKNPAGNPFFGPNPVVAFQASMEKLFAALKAIKDLSAEQQVQAIEQNSDLVNAIADLTRQIGQAEESADIAQGISSIVGGGLSMAGAIGGGLAGGESGIQLGTSVGSGLSSIATGAGSVAQGVYAGKKAGLEALKSILDNLKNVTQQRLQNSQQIFKSADDQMEQAVQALINYYQGKSQALTQLGV